MRASLSAVSWDGGDPAHAARDGDRIAPSFDG
jgi:hypothetical protein